MTQSYFDPSRAEDPYALPVLETFYLDGTDDEGDDAGWYWQACFPGCLPDGDPVGPFATEDEALDDAWEVPDE